MYKGERFNSISHLIGAIAALVGSVLLVVLAARLHLQVQMVQLTPEVVPEDLL